MTDVVAVITGKKRDAVHELLIELLIEHLGGLGDVRLAIDRGDIETARRLAREFAEDFRLLDDIGWGRDERIAVPLTIPPGELTAIFNRLRGEAQSALSESEDEREARNADDAASERYELVLDAGAEVLLEIRGREEST
jgi:hypothetical protein